MVTQNILAVASLAAVCFSMTAAAAAADPIRPVAGPGVPGNFWFAGSVVAVQPDGARRELTTLLGVPVVGNWGDGSVRRYRLGSAR